MYHCDISNTSRYLLYFLICNLIYPTSCDPLFVILMIEPSQDKRKCLQIDNRKSLEASIHYCTELRTVIEQLRNPKLTHIYDYVVYTNINLIYLTYIILVYI